MAGWLLLCGIIGPGVFVVAALVLGATRPNYDPMYTFVSQLSLDGGGDWQVANFLVSGSLIALSGLGLRLTRGARGISRWGWLAVILVGLGFALLGLFRDDPWLRYPPGAPPGIGPPRSPSGFGHLASAFGIFVVLEAGAWSFARGLALDGQARARRICIALAIAFPLLYGAALASGLASGLASSDRLSLLGGLAGLFQRLSLTAALAWVAWLAILFRRAPDPPGAQPP
jgi:hypothetical protein